MSPTRSVPASKIADRLVRQAIHDLAHVRRMDRLYRQGQVKSKDVLRIYRGAYLGFFTQVERALEDPFIGLLTGKVVHATQQCRPRILIPTRPAAVAIINGTNSYTDWMPFDKHTLKRAPAFFVGGEPFKSISKPDRKVLEDATTLRNAIAHGSEHALRQFQRVFAKDNFGAFIIPPQQRNPATYLRGIHAGTQTRLEYRITEIVAVIGRMCA